MNAIDEIDQRISRFMKTNNLPSHLEVHILAAAYIGASIMNEQIMEEQREEALAEAENSH